MAKPLARFLSGLRGGATDTVLWHPAGRPYPTLSGFDPVKEGIAAKSGVYVLWHLGVRPRWIKAGVARNLADAFALMAKTPEIMDLVPHGGVYGAWSFSEVPQGAGLVSFLSTRLTPVLQDLVLSCDVPMLAGVTPIACPLPPGTREVPREVP